MDERTISAEEFAEAVQRYEDAEESRDDWEWAYGRLIDAVAELPDEHLTDKLRDYLELARRRRRRRR